MSHLVSSLSSSFVCFAFPCQLRESRDCFYICAIRELKSTQSISCCRWNLCLSGAAVCSIQRSVCVRRCWVVTTMENGMSASEMTKAIFSARQPQASLDREEGRWERKWAKMEEITKGNMQKGRRENGRNRHGESNRKYYKLYYNNLIFFVHLRGAVRALVCTSVSIFSCSVFSFVTFIILQ